MRETQVVLDARRCPRFATNAKLFDKQHVKTVRGAIHRGCQTSRSSPDDEHAAPLQPMRFPKVESECGGGLPVGGTREDALPTGHHACTVLRQLAPRRQGAPRRTVAAQHGAVGNPVALGERPQPAQVGIALVAGENQAALATERAVRRSRSSRGALFPTTLRNAGSTWMVMRVDAAPSSAPRANPALSSPASTTVDRSKFRVQRSRFRSSAGVHCSSRSSSNSTIGLFGDIDHRDVIDSGTPHCERTSGMRLQDDHQRLLLLIEFSGDHSDRFPSGQHATCAGFAGIGARCRRVARLPDRRS